MKQYYKDIVWALGLVIVALIFFYKVIFEGLLPVPTDTLVGMYHPYRDAYLNEYSSGVPFKNFLITDPVREQIPWRKISVDSWKEGHIPTWDPYSFSGTTLVGNIQAGNFYPLNFWFFLLPFKTAWTILIISQPVLSVVFMFFFLRRKTLGFIASSIGALSFSFGGTAIAWLTWGTIGSTFLWVPLMLLSIDHIHERQRMMLWRIVFLLSTVSSFFAGHIQLFLYGLGIVMWYSIFINRRKPIRFYVWHVISLVLLILLTFPQWYPLVRFLPLSARGTTGATWMAEGFFIPVQHLIQFLVPDYFGNPATLNYWGTWNYGEMVGYIGVAGLLVALFGIGRATFVWIVPVVVSLALSVESPVSVLPYQFSVPILSVFQPTRLLFVVTLCLSVLAGYGIEAIEKVSSRKFLIIFGIVGLVFMGFWVSAFFPTFFHILPEHVIVMKRNLYLPTGIFFVTMLLLFGVYQGRKIHIARVFFLVCLTGVIIFDLFRFGWKFTPFTRASYFFPETQTVTLLMQQKKPFRVMVIDDRLLPPDTLTYYGIESVSGYDPIHLRRYEEFIAAMERGEANITPPFGFERIMTPKNFRSPLFSLLNVSNVVSIDPIEDTRFKLLLEEGQTKVYKYMNVLPRAYFVSNLIVKKTNQEIIDALYSPEFNPAVSAVVETDITMSDFPLDVDETAHIRTYKGSSMTVATHTSENRFLVISNIFDASWKAFIDGVSVPLYRTNYLFQGIIVPSGDHEVSLSYSPYL